jgi:hypothetical protein
MASILERSRFAVGIRLTTSEFVLEIKGTPLPVGPGESRAAEPEQDPSDRPQLPRDHQARGVQDRDHARVHPQARTNWDCLKIRDTYL